MSDITLNLEKLTATLKAAGYRLKLGERYTLVPLGKKQAPTFMGEPQVSETVPVNRALFHGLYKAAGCKGQLPFDDVLRTAIAELGGSDHAPRDKAATVLREQSGYVQHLEQSLAGAELRASAAEALVIQLQGQVDSDAAVEAIKYALTADDPKVFLHNWYHGEFDVLRQEWPDAPDGVYIGADPLYGKRQQEVIHG